LVYIAFGSFKKELLKSDLEVENMSFGKMLAGDLLSISDSDRFIWNFEACDSLEAVLEPFSKGVHSIIVNKHRKHHSTGTSGEQCKTEPIEGQVEKSSMVGVVGHPTSHVKHRLLSQIDVVRFLYHWACDLCLPMLQRNLGELSLVASLKGSSVVVVPETFTALDAFQKMYHSKVNSVAIVNGEGKIIANLSTSDIRYLTNDKFTSLFLPVLLFLHSLHGQGAPKPITVHACSTLDEAMLKMVTAKVKRVWVIDSAEAPVGVVTLTDIISKFAAQDVTPIRPTGQAPRR